MIDLLPLFCSSLSCSAFSPHSSLHSVSPGYGVEHAQCVPPSEYSEPGFITESYQTLHPISSEELLTLKYESEYPAVILRDTPLNPLQGDYFTVKQEVVSPDNMCVGRLSRGEGHITLNSILSNRSEIEAKFRVEKHRSE